MNEMPTLLTSVIRRIGKGKFEIKDSRLASPKLYNSIKRSIPYL
jgi:hypothetical protein